MKALGVGMMIVAVGMALVAGGAGLTFYWTHNPPETFREVQDREDQMKIATSLGLAGDITVLVGVVIFAVEFFVHEHEVRAPTVARAPSARFCTKCGQAVAPDAKFCRHCGKALPD